MRTIATLLLLGSCMGRKDVDLDGLAGRRDACPDRAETPNGYEDEDGCPDELARLRVRVVDQAGAPVAGAEVAFPGAPPMRTDAGGYAMWFDLVPVPELMVEALAADGRRGQATLPLPDGPGDVTITLVEPPNTP